MTIATEQSRRSEHSRQYGGWAADRRVSYQGSTRNRRWTDEQFGQEDDKTERVARGLGWFSVALGLAEIGMPRSLARFIGINDESDETRNTLFALGLRELTSGIGILAGGSRPTGWVWSRVGGDIMDLALLGKAMGQDDNDRGRLTAASAAVLGVTVVDFITGQQLSRGGNGSSGQNGSTRMAGGVSQRQHGIHVVQRITIKRPRNEVYGFWHNFENLPRFMAHLESVEVSGEGRSHWTAKAPAGTTVEWDAETIDDRPNELIAWRSLEDATVPNSGTVRFTDAPGDRGTEVHVELRYQPPGGKLASWVAKLFGEEPDLQVKGDLRRFKQVMEVGEIVHSDASIHSGPHPASPPEDLSKVELLGNRESVAAS
jgi:uncharacterized membrane protein